jgi:FkbM family methyltransferase
MTRNKKPRRFHVLERLIRQKGWTKGAELGVFKGDTFLHLLENCPGLTLIGVDLWAPTPNEIIKDQKTGEQDYARFPMAEYEAHVRGEAKQYGKRAQILKMSTLEAAETIPDQSLDFVFVDASHTTEAVMADIMAWAPKLKPKGRMMGHDSGWPSVKRAIDTLCPAWRPYPNSVWGVPRSGVFDEPPEEVETPVGTIWKVSVAGETLYVPAQKRISRYRRGVRKACALLGKLYGADTLDLSGKTVIDVGANNGEFSLFAAKAGARVYALEPDPIAFECLRRNTPGPREVACLPLALWNKSKRMPFSLATHRGSSSLILTDAKTITATAYRLDRLMERFEIGEVFFLKADCEGAEPEMLEGAGDALAKVRHIAIDCGPERHKQRTENTVRPMLERAGFHVTKIDDKRSILFGARP